MALYKIKASELEECGFQYSVWDTWDKHLEHSARVWRYANGVLSTGLPPSTATMFRTGYTFDLKETYPVNSINEIKKLLALYGD